MEEATYTLLVNWTGGGTGGYPSYGVEFDGAATIGNCDDDASLQDLPDGEITVGAWIRCDGYGENNSGMIVSKNSDGTSGWAFRVDSTHGLVAFMNAATTDAFAQSGLDDFTADGIWRYVTMYYDDDGDRKPYLAIAGTWVAAYTLQQAAVGAIVSDIGVDLAIGNRWDTARTFDGCIGWVAIWQGDHHGVGVDFEPPETCPTLFDEDLIEAWPLSEQTGSTGAAVIDDTNDCALTDHAWTCSWRPGEDCSDDFVSANITRGFAGPLARLATVGRATFVLNNITRQYSPALHADIRPGAAVVFEMTYDGVTTQLFTGQIESIEPGSGEWENLRVVFECYGGMARIDGVEARIALATDVTADEIIVSVVDALPDLPAASCDTGINVFATSADRWVHDPVGGFFKTWYRYYEHSDAAGKIMDAVTADWGRFFIAGDGTPTFFNRHRMALDDTTELTLTTPMDLGYRMAMGEIYNVAEVICNPRSVGAALSDVWEMDTDTPPMIDAGATLTMDCKFVDPTNEAVTIGATDCLPPTAFTDYTATSDELGDGDDKTAQVTVVATFYGDRATLELTNGDANAVYLQTLRIRGTPIRSRGPWTALHESAASQAVHGGRRLKVDAVLLSRPYEAERLAEYLIDVYATPNDQITGVRFCANMSATLMAAARDLELCDRVDLTEYQTGLSSYLGRIYRLVHTIAQDGVTHMVTMDLETAFDPGTPFRLETAPPGGGSTLDSGDVLIY